jgi:glyoxylate/hydroxypyruvate reductase A
MKLGLWFADAPFRRWRDALVQHASELGLAIEVFDACADPDAQADFALVWKPDADWLAGQLGLRAVFNLGAGVESALPLLQRHAPGVPLIRLEDAGMGRQMADYVAECVLHAWRRVDDYAELQRAARWEQLTQLPRGAFKVGFLGLGQMGHAAAKRVAAMDFPVLACTRSGEARPGLEPPGELLPLQRLDEFLAQTRVLVVLLPLTAQTTRLLDYAALRQLPQGAYVVNAARGAVLDTTDLLELLNDGHLGGATLDVFDTEPLPAHSPLWRQPRLRLTPHVAAQTLIGPAAAQILRNIAALERGETPGGLVDMRLGY